MYRSSEPHQASQTNHIAKSTAHPNASNTTSGAGNSVSKPVSFNTARATSVNMMATRAHTIQDGKYEPRMFLEGAPSHPATSADKPIHVLSLDTFMPLSLVVVAMEESPPFGG